MLRRTNFGMLVDDLGTSSEDEEALAELIKIAESVGMEIIENKTAISIKFCTEIMKKLVESGTTERIHLLNHIENLEERIKRVEELAEGKKPTGIAYWVNGRCNHCGCEAPKTITPEMGGYAITVPDLADYCPGCGYKMER